RYLRLWYSAKTMDGVPGDAKLRHNVARGERPRTCGRESPRLALASVCVLATVLFVLQVGSAESQRTGVSNPAPLHAPDEKTIPGGPVIDIPLRRQRARAAGHPSFRICGRRRLSYTRRPTESFQPVRSLVRTRAAAPDCPRDP